VTHEAITARLRKFIELSLHEDEKNWKDWISRTVQPIKAECWEMLECEAAVAQNCPAYMSDCGRCWLTAGTMCGGTVQGGFAKKYSTCVECDVFQKTVFRDSATELQEHILILIHCLRSKQQQLQETKNQYRMLFDDAPIMYVTTYLDNETPIIEDCNDEFLHALGYQRDEVLEQPLSRFYSEESKRALQDGGYKKALAAGINEVERLLIKNDGSLLHTLLKATPRGDSRPGGSLVMFVDISERKRTEKEIKENREQLQDAFDQISWLIQEVIVTHNVELRYKNLQLIKCYEEKDCDQGDCLCYGKEPMRCWQIAGTFCGGEEQGTYAQKYKNCKMCEVFKHAAYDPANMLGEHFNNMMHILKLKHDDLQKALDEIKTLRGIVPICSYCKQIRDDKGFWNKVEAYIQDHTEAKFSHGVCPDCAKRYYPEFAERIVK